MRTFSAINEMYQIYTNEGDLMRATHLADAVWRRETDALSGEDLQKKVTKLQACAQHQPQPQFYEFVRAIAKHAAGARPLSLNEGIRRPLQPSVLRRETPVDQIRRQLDVQGRTLSQVCLQVGAQGPYDTATLGRLFQSLSDETAGSPQAKQLHKCIDQIIASTPIEAMDTCLKWLSYAGASIDLVDLFDNFQRISAEVQKAHQQSRPLPQFSHKELADAADARPLLKYLAIAEPHAMPRFENVPGLEDQLLVWLHHEWLETHAAEMAHVRKATLLIELFDRFAVDGNKVIDDLDWSRRDKEAARALCAISYEMNRCSLNWLQRGAALVRREHGARLDRKIAKLQATVPAAAMLATGPSYPPGAASAAVAPHGGAPAALAPRGAAPAASAPHDTASTALAPHSAASAAPAPQAAAASDADLLCTLLEQRAVFTASVCGRPAAALKDYQLLIKYRPAARLYLQRGLVLADMQRYRDAERDACAADRALRHPQAAGPSESGVDLLHLYAFRADLRLRLQRPADALADIIKVRLLAVGRPYDERQEDLEHAWQAAHLADLEAAKALNPADMAVWLELQRAKTLLTLNNLTGAQAAYAALLRARPNLQEAKAGVAAALDSEDFQLHMPTGDLTGQPVPQDYQEVEQLQQLMAAMGAGDLGTPQPLSTVVELPEVEPEAEAASDSPRSFYSATGSLGDGEG
jgi:hypothetical protein